MPLTLDQIKALPDACQRAREALRFINAGKQASAIRADAIREMAQTMSYGQIGKALDLSRARVGQIINERVTLPRSRPAPTVEASSEGAGAGRATLR